MLIGKTEAGHTVVKDRSVPLTPRQRSAFILCDGKRTRDEVLAATAGIGVTPEDLQALFDLGLVSDMSGGATRADSMPAALSTMPLPIAAAPAGPTVPPASPQEKYALAYPIAVKLTSALGLRGFRLNLAVEGAGSYDDLVKVAPRIREAVGAKLYAPLARALGEDDAD